jgi:hypothetical protein
MTNELALRLAALAFSVPLTAALLRRTRRRRTRALEERLRTRDISAGTAANLLDQSSRLQWSGFLTVADGRLRWEPDPASRRRNAEPAAWPLATTRIEIIGTGRGFTGERYAKLRIAPTDSPPTEVVTFTEVGPWRELLRLP